MNSSRLRTLAHSAAQEVITFLGAYRIHVFAQSCTVCRTHLGLGEVRSSEGLVRSSDAVEQLRLFSYRSIGMAISSETDTRRLQIVRMLKDVDQYYYVDQSTSLDGSWLAID